MPREIKDKVVEKNHRLLLKVSAAIFVLCILTLIPLISTPEKRGPETADYIFHYSSMAMSRWFYIKRNYVHEYKTKEWEKQVQQELEMAAVVQKSFYNHNLNVVNN